MSGGLRILRECIMLSLVDLVAVAVKAMTFTVGGIRLRTSPRQL